MDVAAEYLSWPLIREIGLQHFNGPVERRGGALIDHSRERLRLRMAAYFDSNVTNGEIGEIHSSLMMTGNRIVGPDARAKIINEHRFSDANLVRYPYKPLDTRWCYLDSIRPLFSEPSPRLIRMGRIEGNAFLVTRDTADKSREGSPFFFSSHICDYDAISGHARHFPILVTSKQKRRRVDEAQGDLMPDAVEPVYAIPNLSEPAFYYMSSLTASAAVDEYASSVWMHVLAVGFSKTYLAENADGIRQDWPRIPLPVRAEDLEASAALGRQIADLLDTDKPFDGVTVGDIRLELLHLGVPTRTEDGNFDPSSGELDQTAGWGHFGKNRVCMPGKGKYSERAQRDKALRKAFGDKTLDVYWNDMGYWSNVPRAIWDYHIGGYQVIKKWLSYREKTILDRALKLEEIEYVQEMVRRIGAIILLQPELDENYQRVKADTYKWPLA